jgi:branched-chain amino acid transport system permease protein
MLVAGNKNIEGIIVIGIGLGILEAMVAGYLSSNFRDAIAFALLLGILFFRPSGLFGSYPESE